jgi:hypothetical protein
MEDPQKPSVSEEDVSAVLKRRLKSDTEVESFSLDMLGEWVGNCGDHAILNVTLKSNNESPERYSFFVKLYPRLEFVIEFIEGNGSFKKEIFVYKLFDLMHDEQIKILSDCVPMCYLTTPYKYLVLDNLAEEKYQSPDKHQVLDYDTVRVVLEALAKLHASTLIYEEKKSCRLIDLYGEDFAETYFNDREDFPNKEGLDAALKGIVKCIELFDFSEKLLSGKDFKTVLEEVCARIYALAKPSKKFRNVVCHGDIWVTNVLVKRDDCGKPVKCKLVDFQCARYTPPAQDVMSFIHLTTSRDFRRKYMYNLIGIYYTSLEKHVTLAGYDMKTVIPFDEFLASCEEQKVFGLVQTGIYFPLILLRTKVIKDYFGNKESNREALLEDRSILVRENMDDDDAYKNRIRDCIQDLKDYCDYL